MADDCFQRARTYSWTDWRSVVDCPGGRPQGRTLRVWGLCICRRAGEQDQTHARLSDHRHPQLANPVHMPVHPVAALYRADARRRAGQDDVARPQNEQFR